MTVSNDSKLRDAASLRGVHLSLFVRDVRDRQGRKRNIQVRCWSTIQDVKNAIYKQIHVPPGAQRLFFGPLLTSGKELPNHRTLHDIGIYKSGATLLLDIRNSHDGSASTLSQKMPAKSDVCISSSVIAFTPRAMKSLVRRAMQGLTFGLKPEFILEGSGGTYYLHDARKTKIGVFKASDEEPYAENNPRGYLPYPGRDASLRQGVQPGEACIREVAAFMLDHDGFSSVPMTTLVEARHPSFNTNGSRLKVAEGGAAMGAHSIISSPGAAASGSTAKKVGSFQEYVRCEDSMDDISPSKLSVDEVHKIAVLDIRLMNADRNAANLLCRRRSDNSIELIPIDHGYCLRSVADVSWMDWCWLDWPQLKQPMSDKTKEYIRNLNIENDARLLRDRLNICREALDYFCASCSILKAGAQAGLTLYDIAVMCCRNDNLAEVPSKLEVLFSMAAELAENAIENGRWHHSAASKALEDQLSPKGASLLSPATNNGGIAKAKSAVDLIKYSGGLASLVVDTDKRDALPEMIKSSASDSSSDTQEGEECDEWAATLIADVSLDKSLALADKKSRSLSIESDSSSESEQGFWHVRPDTSPDASDNEEDSDSFTWSPSASPRNILNLSSIALHDDMKKCFNPIADEYRHLSSANERRASIQLSDSPSALDNSFQQFRTPKVSFAVEEKKEDSLADPRFKHSNSDAGNHGDSEVPQRKSSGGGLRRSQSYSALTSTTTEKLVSEETHEKPMGGRPIDHEQYRSYFLKFVDLVIVRETTAAGRLAKAQG